MTITENYNLELNTLSDINEHLFTLKTAASKCQHITEFGVRSGVSTWALLAGKPETIISYDINRHPNISQIEAAAKEEATDFRFVCANVLTVDIEPTDMLFIDTLHTYRQLNSELTMHGNKVRKYIIMHDTETYGHTDMEDVYRVNTNIDPVLFSGLKPAIEQFVTTNQHWKLLKHFKNNNGLTVLYNANFVSGKT